MGRACRRGKGLVDAQVQQSQSYHEALCRFNLLHYILPSILSLDCLFLHIGETWNFCVVNHSPLCSHFPELLLNESRPAFPQDPMAKSVN